MEIVDSEAPCELANTSVFNCGLAFRSDEDIKVARRVKSSVGKGQAKVVCARWIS
jgi:hypothetical protein